MEKRGIRGDSFAKLNKKIWDSKLSKNPKFIALAAFLASKSTYKPTTDYVFGYKVNYPEGVYTGTIRDISRLTGIPRSTVHRILSRMVELKLIEYASVTNWLEINQKNGTKVASKNKSYPSRNDEKITEWDKNRKKLNDTLVKNLTTRRLVNFNNFKVIRVLNAFKKVGTNFTDLGFGHVHLENVGQESQKTGMCFP